MICCNSLLQNATNIITKCGSYFITKCDKSLLQDATVLLQITTVITNCDDFITKCHSYYKMRRLLQIATVHSWKYKWTVQVYFKAKDVSILSWPRGTFHGNFQPGLKFIAVWIQLYLWSKFSLWLHAETILKFSITVISTGS